MPCPELQRAGLFQRSSRISRQEEAQAAAQAGHSGRAEVDQARTGDPKADQPEAAFRGHSPPAAASREPAEHGPAANRAARPASPTRQAAAASVRVQGLVQIHEVQVVRDGLGQRPAREGQTPENRAQAGNRSPASAADRGLISGDLRDRDRLDRGHLVRELPGQDQQAQARVRVRIRGRISKRARVRRRVLGRRREADREGRAARNSVLDRAGHDRVGLAQVAVALADRDQVGQDREDRGPVGRAPAESAASCGGRFRLRPCGTRTAGTRE
jgi:hypothetical protein